MTKEADEEKLINEVKNLLSQGKGSVMETKKVVFDKTTKQYSLKIPKSISDGAQLNEKTEFEMVFNPSVQDIERAIESHVIIYAKTKTNTKSD